VGGRIAYGTAIESNAGAIAEGIKIKHFSLFFDPPHPNPLQQERELSS